MNSCQGISSTALDSPFMAKNSVSRAIFYSVFLAFWWIIFLSFDNSSTETISSCISVYSLIAQRQRRDLLFFLVKESDHFRLRPVIGHTIIFTSDKNRPTNQIDSNFQLMNSPFKIRSNIPTSITVNFLFTLHELLMSSRRHVSKMKGKVTEDFEPRYNSDTRLLQTPDEIGTSAKSWATYS